MAARAPSGFLQRLESGPQEHHPADAHFSTWAAERAIAFLAERDPARPFFLNVSLFDPHSPYFDYPPEAGELVDRDAIGPVRPLTAAHEPVPGGVAREREGFQRRYGRRAGGRGLADVRHGYYASVAFLDRQVGRILAELERRGLADNTLVLFVSDHGDMIGDYELITKGAYFYDPCTRVPMILRLPDGERAGTRVADLVQPHDLAATLLHAAGMPAADVAALMPESQDLAALARGATGAAAGDGPRLRAHHVPQLRLRQPRLLGPADLRHHVPRRPLQAEPVPRPRRAPRAGGRTVRHDRRPPPKPPTCGTCPEHAARRAHLTDRLHATLVASEMHHVAGRGGTSWPPAKT